MWSTSRGEPPLNILMVNASWYPSGGDWSLVQRACQLYEAAGQKIVPFSMHDDRNVPTEFEKYFVSPIDYKQLNASKSISTGLQVLSRSIYSREAVRKLTALLDDYPVDVAKLHNVHNVLTPSIVPVLHRRGIPIVWRVLDYKLICPNRTFLSNGEICERCYPQRYFQVVANRCKKGSVAASLIAAMESYAYRVLPYYDFVERFLFQSEFTRDLFVKFGYDPKRTQIIENPFDANQVTPVFDGKDHILFLGRISPEKGLYTLLEAMRQLPRVGLRVVGDGPELEGSRRFADEHQLTNVTFVGHRSGAALYRELIDCRFVVVPSVWYDPCPVVVLEAFAHGKPVIGSRIGGIPDMVQSGVHGVLTEAGSAADLVGAISHLFDDRDAIRAMGMRARQLVETKYSAQRYCAATLGLFESLVSNAQRT